MNTNPSPVVAYAASTAVGSGKTRAAVEYIASKASSQQNFIYVAPTIRLIDQTTANLKEALGDSDSNRDVTLIHSESRQLEEVPVSVQTTDIINSASVDGGRVVIITTTTFLKIINDLTSPQHWRVIIDEGFSPVEFLKVHLGTRAEKGLDHFLEVFAIDPVQSHRIIPARGQEDWVDHLATQGLRRAGEQYTTFQPLATAVANDIMRCEMVMTEKTRSILGRTFAEKAPYQDHPARVASESEFLIARYVTPDWVRGFGEVIFMSALFEQTLLYQFWTRLFGVSFVEHPAFPKTSLRNIHIDQGMHVHVGHLLHPKDTSSRHNLGRSFVDGSPNELEQGLRAIDRLVTISSEYFADQRFLLQTNNDYGYFAGSPLMPSNAIKVPASSHGLNEFQDHDNVAALAVTNPTPEVSRWIMGKTGLDREQTQMAFRLHTTYQAVGRSSIRKADPTSDKKVFLTAGRSDALMLHEIFEGSHWLGQVGDMIHLAEAHEDNQPATAEHLLSQRILQHLDGVSEDIAKVSSRSLKELLGGAYSPSTWTRSVNLALNDEYNHSWTFIGQSFIRRDAASYGFMVEDGSTTEDVS